MADIVWEGRDGAGSPISGSLSIPVEPSLIAGLGYHPVFEDHFDDGQLDPRLSSTRLAADLVAAALRVTRTLREQCSLTREWADKAACLERKLARATSTLMWLDRNGCRNYTHGRCLDDPSRSMGAKESADAWCDACVAANALKELE
jgi:hypothetical protein